MSHQSESLPPDLVKKVIDAAVSKKPIGYSSSSNLPYFSKIYGEEIKTAVDKMRIDKNDIIYRYSVWCTVQTGISTQTLYARVNQSLKFLLERLDPDSIYKDWREHVTVSRSTGIGIVISYKPGFGNNTHFTIAPEHVIPADNKPVWYRHMVEWIEDEDTTEPFVKENLVLSEQEQVDIKVVLSGNKTLRYSIDESSVKIIKV